MTNERVVWSDGKLRVGKFKRRTVAQLPDHYVVYLLRCNTDLPDDLVKALLVSLLDRVGSVLNQYQLGGLLQTLPPDWRPVAAVSGRSDSR